MEANLAFPDNAVTDVARQPTSSVTRPAVDAIMWWLPVASAVLVAATIYLLQEAKPANYSFKDTAAALGFITAAALGIERFIETLWTIVGNTKLGAYWPFNVVTDQIESMTADLTKALLPFQEAADKALLEGKAQLTEVEAAAKDAKNKITKLTAQLQELHKLAPGNQRRQLLSATVSQQVNVLQATYGTLLPDFNHAAAVANASIDGLQNFLATFKDNSGRRLISLCFGALLGLGLAAAFRLDLFSAVLNATTDESNSIISPLAAAVRVVLTGLIIGLGSNPTHEVIRAVQVFKERKKGLSIAQPDQPFTPAP
ncbi:hypothetical protein H8B15_05960 [Hymenobacter sp. BT507]|uniref:MotA/TolQ/ExbB proton channel domain-containing protein n=1 Tax=Hymenobacter citatus TaxID=2763506 RepID=A0ABR7MH79_9BACT|nr:hypothetical protein [Hymenobacter citatus]MBC6610456.1 hypothetical protein [Hymenobacter citatus]